MKIIWETAPKRHGAQLFGGGAQKDLPQKLPFVEFTVKYYLYFMH